MPFKPPHAISFVALRAIEEDGFGEMQKFNSEIQQVFLDYYISLLHDYSLYICESQSDFVIFDKVSRATHCVWNLKLLRFSPLYLLQDVVFGSDSRMYGQEITAGNVRLATVCFRNAYRR